MEFLLQLFADFLGTPEEENLKIQENKKNEKIEKEVVPVPEITKEEEPVLFGLMQFH